MSRALKVALAHAGMLVCMLFLTLFTVLFGWPTDVERHGAVVESVSVDFGLPFPFARASVSDSQAWHYAEDAGRLRHFNPWDTPTDFHGPSFLLSWLIFAACGAATVELGRYRLRTSPHS